jgi:AraC family transcriptional regulator
MESLESGRFYGISRKYFHLNGLTVVDSGFYDCPGCPWHYHEIAHFAFTTRGKLVETHKKKRIQLSAGSLLYNHSDEPHYNSDYSGYVSALHVDIDTNWFKKNNINFSGIEGVAEINNPVIKNIFLKLFKEINDFDNISNLSIECLVVQSINEMMRANFLLERGKPSWIIKIWDLLYDGYSENISLQEIAAEINLHPVYLCQQFPVYFNCTFGDYIRKIRIEKATDLMFSSPHLSLTFIANACGFSDQSHFTRLFKKNIGLTPLAFRKIIGSLQNRHP